MSGIFGGGQKNTPPSYTSLALNTSAYGLPIPLYFGCTRAAPNLLWDQNFQSIAHQSSSGGKGGGATVSNYTYTSDIICGLCEGPITGINNIWISGNDSSSTLAAQGMGLALGNYGQAPWSYLAATYANQAVPYSGIAYTYSEAYNLGQSASLPNWGMEIQGFLYGTAPNGMDADPSQVIAGLLTNPHWGGGFPSNRFGTLAVASEVHTIPPAAPYQVTVNESSIYAWNLDVTFLGVPLTCVPGAPGPGQYSQNGAGLYTFNSGGGTVTINYATRTPALPAYQAYTLSQGLWISPGYTSQTALASMLTDIATFTNSRLVFSSGVLTVVPNGTVNITGNGYTYTAPSAPVVSFTEDDFLPNQGSASSSVTDDPVLLTHLRPADQYNDIQIEVLDRNNQYSASICEVPDSALMNKFGRRSQGVQAAHLFSDVVAGNTSVQLLLQRQHIQNKFSHTADIRFSFLDPADVVALTEPDMYLSDQWAAILEIQENDDGTLSFITEEFPTGTGAAATYVVNNSTAIQQNYNAPSPDINTPIIFCPPVAICPSNGLEVWAAVSGLSSSWGGCNVWLSLDGSSYRLAETLNGASRMGVTTSALPIGADPDTTNSVGVNLSVSNGELAGGTAADANQLVTLCYLDGEFISYQSATLTSANNYTLGTLLRRGQHGSAPAAHAINSPFARLDENIAKIQINSLQVGQTVYVKFQSFNLFGGGVLPLSSLTVYPFTIEGAPNNYLVSSIAAAPGFQSVNLTWLNPPNALTALAAVEVWRNTANDITTATHIGDTAHQSAVYVDSGLTTGTAYYYWVRVRDIASNEGPWSESVSATPIQVAANDIATSAVAGAVADANSIQNNFVFAGPTGSVMQAAQPISAISVSTPEGTGVVDVTALAFESGSVPGFVANLATTVATNYLDKASAAATYLTQTDATATYATASSLASLSSIYLGISTASATYLTQTTAAATYATASSLVSLASSFGVTASQVSTLNSAVLSSIGGGGSLQSQVSALNSGLAGIPGTYAAITSLNNTSTTAGAAVAAAAATVVAANTNGYATITTINSTIAGATGTGATSLTALATAVGAQGGNISTLSSSVTSLAGITTTQYGVTLTNIGSGGVQAVSGFQLLNGGSSSSSFNVNADAFNIYSATYPLAAAFAIGYDGTIGAHGAMVVTSAGIGTAAVQTHHVGANQINSSHIASISASVINGLTLIGNTIETAASGARTVISATNNALTSYDSGGNIVAQVGSGTGWAAGQFWVPSGNPGGLISSLNAFSQVSTVPALNVGGWIQMQMQGGVNKITDMSGNATISLGGQASFGSLVLPGTTTANITGAYNITASNNIAAGYFSSSGISSFSQVDFSYLASYLGYVSPDPYIAYDTTGHVITVHGASSSAGYSFQVLGQSGKHAFMGQAFNTAGTAAVGAGMVGFYVSDTSGYAFKAMAGTAGPFTGSHDALILKTDTPPVLGDIVVGTSIVKHGDISNTVAQITRSVTPNDKRAIGVFVSSSGLTDQNVPVPYLAPITVTSIAPDGTESTTTKFVVTDDYTSIEATYNVCLINALGEGQINVVGEGGDIAIGDLIVTSSTPGNGMKQADDIVRNYTVAKAREAVSFGGTTTVPQMIACIYVCG